MTYYNWQEATKADGLRFRKASPNLLALKEALVKRWGGSNIGIYNRRPVRGGTAPSSHSYGAALDWRYENRRNAVIAMNWMVKNHRKLGVQNIVDYVGCTQWIVGVGWRQMKPNAQTGVGQSWAKWLHVETTKEEWGNSTPVANRLG